VVLNAPVALVFAEIKRLVALDVKAPVPVSKKVWKFTLVPACARKLDAPIAKLVLSCTVLADDPVPAWKVKGVDPVEVIVPPVCEMVWVEDALLNLTIVVEVVLDPGFVIAPPV
jgi:hypothetical protein